MNVNFKFFGDEAWSVKTTISTLFNIVVYKLFSIKLDLPVLVLSSLSSMIDPNTRLVDRVVFSSFLSLMTKSVPVLAVTIFQSFVTHHAQYYLFLATVFVLRETVLKFTIFAAIAGWMFYIPLKFLGY